VLSRRTVYAIGILVLVSVSLTYVLFARSPASSCGESLGFATVSKFDLQPVHFEGITKFHLPGNEFPNGIAVDQDGSVWFGEQDVPGFGHLFENGTMMEYAWPLNYSPSTTSIWGVAVWDGRIWASDELGGQIVVLDPTTLTLSAVKLGNLSAFPYTLTVGPDDALWFTEIYDSKVGRIDSKCHIAEYAIPTNFGGTPTQIAFQNQTGGYYADAGNATSSASTILAFNIAKFAPQPFDGNFRPRVASSLALGPTGLWVAQHASSNLAYYDFEAKTWTQYPTTPVDYISTTLPYFVATNRSLVWFNEHYANRIGVIDTTNNLLTEYSLSNPPANKTAEIDNALTFALGKNEVWFTELTANYVGYVDATYKPTFTIHAKQDSLSVKAGDNVSFSLAVGGVSTKPLAIIFADNENFTSRPSQIAMNVTRPEIPSLLGPSWINVTITSDRMLKPGRYILLVTVTDESVNEGTYLTLDVTA
jgi:virginiamycin B lyase